MRVYDGCPDRDIEKLLDEREKLRQLLHKKIPGARVVYLPAEGNWAVFLDNKMIGPESENFDYAVLAALKEQNVKLQRSTES